MIQCGDRVKDKITGLKGIVVGITNWLYGCTRLTVQPEQTAEGKPAETFCIDEPQSELLKAGVIHGVTNVAVSSPKRHGPRNDPQRRRDAVRQ